MSALYQKFTKGFIMTYFRLDKFIGDHCELSRSQIKVLIKNGKVCVDGVTAKSPDSKIDPDLNSVSLDGKPICYRKNTYILLNKPEGFVCSTDPKDGANVIDLVPPQLRVKGLFPAGRLDKDTLGAVLLTDDGQLAHKILSPASHIPKIYLVKLAKPFKSNYFNKFSDGLLLENGEVCMPALVSPVENNENWAFIQLHEGKYHQVKRMFAAVENHVDALMRVSLGGLKIPENLGKGQSIELLHKDVENLFLTPDFNRFCSDNFVIFSSYLINK